MIWRVASLFISVFYSDRNSLRLRLWDLIIIILNRSRNRSENLQGIYLCFKYFIMTKLPLANECF